MAQLIVTIADGDLARVNLALAQAHGYVGVTTDTTAIATDAQKALVAFVTQTVTNVELGQAMAAQADPVIVPPVVS